MGKRTFDPSTVDAVSESVEKLVSSCNNSFDSMSAEEVEEVQRNMFLAARDLQGSAVQLYTTIRIKRSERRLQEAKTAFGKSDDPSGA